MRAPAVLALDPATLTGFATSDGRSGAVDFANHRRDDRPPAARHGSIAYRFRLWLDSEISRGEIGVLVLERQMMGKGGGELSLGLRLVALELATARQLLIDEVAPATWQAWAKWNHDWTRAAKGDEADALMILRWWQAIRAGQLIEAAPDPLVPEAAS